MKEKILYALKYAVLLGKWGIEYDFLLAHPDNESSKIKERQLWNELIELEEMMKTKKFS